MKPVCCPYCKSEEIDTEYNLLCKKLGRLTLVVENNLERKEKEDERFKE